MKVAFGKIIIAIIKTTIKIINCFKINIIDIIEIRTTKDYYEKLYVNKLDNIHKKDKILETN